MPHYCRGERLRVREKKRTRSGSFRKATGKHNISTGGFCFLPDEGGQHLFRKQPHLPVDLIDLLVAEQPYIPKGAHQMV